MIDMVSVKKTFPIVAWMVELEDGLKKEHIIKMLDMMPEDVEVMTFSSSENNSSVYGFITSEAFENINYNEEYLQDFLWSILNDWNNESPDKIYTLPNGLKMYIGCDCETIIEGN